MAFDPSTAVYLKPWLVKTLEPICDAEPGALAEYILALLKHNLPEPEMRKELASQLDEFLEKECEPFINTLFTALRSKSYVPYSDPSPSTSYVHPEDAGIPIPLDALLSPKPTSPGRNSRKRSIEDDGRDGRPPSKGPRMEGQYSRYGGGRGGGSTGSWAQGDMSEMNAAAMMGMNMAAMGMIPPGMAMSMGPGMGMGEGQAYRPPQDKRPICRDYHNNGYCARGAYCKFSHGDDAIVPPMFPPIANGMPFANFPPDLSPYPSGSGAYDPNEAQMDMRHLPSGPRQQQRAPFIPRIQKEDGSHAEVLPNGSGELPVIQDLTPDKRVQAYMGSDFASGSTHMDPMVISAQMMNDVYHMAMMNGMPPLQGGMPYPNMNGPPSMDVDTPDGPQRSTNGRGGFRGGNTRGAPRGGGRPNGPNIGDHAAASRPARREDKTLVVEKIPEDKLSINALTEWFKRFGTVTNVAIERHGSKALISFAEHEDARKAWKSEEAVFGNRFVKVFWHRPMEGHGQIGAKMLAASAPIVAAKSKIDTEAPKPVLSKPQAPATRKPAASTSALAAKQQLLESQIAEQKSLMDSLETASIEEKKGIMARLRTLGAEMKPTPIVPVPASRDSDSPSLDEQEVKKELLDLETESDNGRNTTADVKPDVKEDLAAKLERLKAEAASLGIEEPPYGGHNPSYRPYRGRGRGSTRSYYRGAVARGAAPRASMKLDNRPKKLLVKGVSEVEAVREKDLKAVHDWYETSGQMESVERLDNGDVVVTFKNRFAAEQGLAKGPHIATVGQVQISWYTGTTQATPSVITSKTIEQDQHMRPPSPIERAQSPQIQEEDPVASGWGGDDDGGMGLGM